MSRFALACLCALAFGLAPAGAQTTPTPAPPSPEAVKIVAAMAKMTSFRMQLTSTNGMAGTITVVVPTKRTKAMVAMGPMVSEMVSADGKMYVRLNGAEWRTVDAPGGNYSDMALKTMADPSKLRVLPDRVENGTTVGVYEMTPALPPGAPAGTPISPLTCTYDKTTYLPRSCTFQTMTQTFEGWNDPANTVDLPVLASPAPAASPHP
jgi:hypothetical protein